jgi:hypothetical protein
MFFSRRTPRSSAARPRRARLPIRPILEALEDRITPTGGTTVTNLADTGANTLRDAVKAANNDTTGGPFTINLIGGTYTLSQASPLLLNNTSGTTIVIEGATDPTTGKPTTTIDETAASRIFQVATGTTVILDNVKITHGKAQDANGAGGFDRVGGGLLNNGGTVALTNVTVSANSAASALAGGAAGGGGIFSTGGTISLNGVTLSGNTAQGGAGTTAKNGGAAFGGGFGEINTKVIVTNKNVTPGNPAQFLSSGFNPSGLAAPLITISGNEAQGGLGGNGTTNQRNGTNGGQGIGGGLWLSGGTVDLVAASITNNMALAGDGGAGNSGPANKVGAGGIGESGFGGGIEMQAGANTAVTVRFSTIDDNTAQGGNGGRGGDGAVAGVAGGNGGNAGAGVGGGLEVFAANSVLNMVDSTVAFNNADAGAGGAGGNGKGAAGGTGGNGGFGGGAIGAFGGGLDVRTGNTTSTLQSVTIADNNINNNNLNSNSSIAGQGGENLTTMVAAGPGLPGTAAAGGINSDGSAILKNSLVAANNLKAGNTAGSGPDVGGTLNLGGTQFTFFGNPNGANLPAAPANNDIYGGATNPGLAAQLADNGGATQTLALQLGSPVIGKGTTGLPGSTFDQRGVARSNGVDLGAFQHTAASAAVGNVVVNPTFLAANTSGSVTVSASVTSSAGAINEGTVTFKLFNGNTPVLDSSGNPIQVTSGTLANGATGDVKWNLPALPAASYTIQATYTDPNGNFVASQPGTATLTVGSTTIAATGSVTPATINVNPTASTNVTVNATLTADSKPVSGGTVVFKIVGLDSLENPVTIGTSDSTQVGLNGQVQASVTVLPGAKAGGYTVQAIYTNAAGIQSQPANVANASLTIQEVPTTISIASASASTNGVTASANVSVKGTGTGVNQGGVTFSLFDSSNRLVGFNPSPAPVTNGSTGPVTIGSNLAPGNYTLQATYADSAGTYQTISTSQTVNVPAPAPVSPPPASPPAPPAPTPVPPLQAIFTLYFDGFEKVLQGDSPALEASINANMPYAVFAGFDFGPLALLVGEMAASGSLHG